MEASRRYVIMGVAGSGKTVVGSAFAHALGVPFVDGDDYHSPENVERMARGVPLTDADRADWLRTLAGKLADARARDAGLVLACSALKRSYRDLLREGDAEARFILLRGSRELIATRLRERKGHFMPETLLASQFATLENPMFDERAWVCDVAASPDEIVADLVRRATR